MISRILRLYNDSIARRCHGAPSIASTGRGFTPHLSPPEAYRILAQHPSAPALRSHSLLEQNTPLDYGRRRPGMARISWMLDSVDW